MRCLHLVILALLVAPSAPSFAKPKQQTVARIPIPRPPPPGVHNGLNNQTKNPAFPATLERLGKKVRDSFKCKGSGTSGVANSTPQRC